MKELLSRFIRRPFLTIELLVATLFITVLNLASPIFVIQVLNRYVSHGITGTLITLTIGMLIAMFLQFFFRLIRTRISSDISLEADQQLAAKVLDALGNARALDLLDFGRNRLQESANRLQHIRNGYSGANITSFMDGPFVVLYLLAAFIISPLLAGIGLIAILVGILFGITNVILSARTSMATQQKSIEQRSLIMSAINNLETVRIFSGIDFLKRPFHAVTDSLLNRARKELSGKELYKSVTMFLTILLSVTLYAVGAIQVVKGVLSVGALIGINILVTRAFSTLTQFVLSISLINRAQREYSSLIEIINLPMETDSGNSLQEYRGNVELRGLDFAYPASHNSLFTDINIRLKPGDRLIITGQNGTGKTTLIRLITGLIDPSRGSVLVDKVDLRQIDPHWWRAQLIYLPQEPTFLQSTIQEAITMAASDMPDEKLQEIITRSGLNEYLNNSVDGLSTYLGEEGRSLPQGIRRRLALARALATSGRLVVLDEPTEGLDEQGCHTVYRLLNELAKDGKTMVIVTRDQQIIKGASHIINLDLKPVPEIHIVSKSDG